MLAVLRAALYVGVILSARTLAPAADTYPVVTDHLNTPQAIPWPDGEVASPAQITLGKQLFFDRRLSGTGTISCATCHDPARGWGDGLTKGLGAHGDLLPRHTPALVNPAWGTLFFWDGRATSLEQQALGPISNPLEMDLPEEQIVPQLSKVPGYRTGFASAYAEGLTVDNVGHAIASFERTLVSRNSPFDRYAAGERDALNPAARRGLTLFLDQANCASCHRGANFTNQSFHNLGFRDQSDVGRAAIIPGATMHAAFKTPSLRNIALTAPYFHDGSATTLAEVIAFYNRGGEASFQSTHLSELALSAEDQHALVAFLEALTDPIVVEPPTLPPDEPPVQP